jgi:hypothetical protein
MSTDRLFLDSVDLRHAASRIRGNERVARLIGAALPEVQIEFPADDPVRTHSSFMPAFTEFTATWGREIGYVADAARDISADLDLTAAWLLEQDTSNAAKATSIGSPR